MEVIQAPKHYRLDNSVPENYQQPSRTEYIGRVIKNNIEMVDYVPESHVRIWYNNQDIGYPLHTHDSLEVFICIENNYQINVNDTVYYLKEGDILMIPPRIPHEYINDKKGIRFIYLMDMNSFFSSKDYTNIESLFFNAYLCNKELCPEIYDKVYRLFMDMNDVYFSNSPFWETTVFSKILQVFVEIGKQALKPQQNIDKSTSQALSRITALLHYIDINYAEELSTEQAATFSGFSKYHFLRLFKQHTGYTFHDYLNLKRIQIAEELLITDLPITDIAFKTGFNTLPSFCRAFKKYTNHSPSEYKKLRITEGIDNHLKNN